MHDYQKRLNQIQDNIKTDAHIVGVSKYSSIEQIMGFYQAGLKHFGENRVETLLEKSEYFNSLEDVSPLWHFVGKIQSKKINKLFSVKNLDTLHSVDSLSLLEKLYQKSSKIVNESGVNFFLQVNISDETQKSGLCDYNSLLEAYKKALELENDKLRVIGIMGMGRIRTTSFEADAHENFQKMREFKENLEKDLLNDFGKINIQLSMGMSQDYHIATEYGADYIRLGRCLFFEE